MSRSYSGTYVGPIAHLRGEEALVEPKSGTRILVQFNNLNAFRRSYRYNQMKPRGLKKHLAYRWHSFPGEHWIVTDSRTGQAAL